MNPLCLKPPDGVKRFRAAPAAIERYGVCSRPKCAVPRRRGVGGYACILRQLVSVAAPPPSPLRTAPAAVRVVYHRDGLARADSGTPAYGVSVCHRHLRRTRQFRDRRLCAMRQYPVCCRRRARSVSLFDAHLKILDCPRCNAPLRVFAIPFGFDN